MKEKRMTIKEVSLNNNCPECFSNKGLRLSFSQKFVENTFYKSVTSEINHEISCITCNTMIYPVQWTDDIERVFEYQKKTFSPKKPFTYLKKISWIIIFIILGLIITTLGLVLWSKL